MSVNKLISEAVKHEILQRESVGGFHAIFETVGENVLRGLEEARMTGSPRSYQRGGNANIPDLDDAEQEYEREKNKYSKYNIPPKQIFSKFKEFSESERAEITKDTIENFLESLFQNKIFQNIALAKNTNNQKLALDILQYAAGDQTSGSLGRIVNQSFDIYLDVLITYYFSGKKPVPITGNKQIDNFILKEIKKRLLSDLKNKDIPNWMQDVPLNVKKNVLKKLKEIGRESLNEDGLENKKDKSKKQKAVATANAIIKRAQIVLSGLNPNEELLNDMLDLIANMLIRKNTDLNETLTSVIANEVQSKVDRLKNGRLALSNIIGALADNNLLGSGGSLIQAVFGFNRETMALIRQELSRI